ncbi:hypothetical protein K2173_009668 [Erythroxylum novogranatense]|uniref:Uncharacterized protein n=1 Tax=Erythroxylum novogranatense TaxID=1862640 RepID=A0AAV8U4K0_9ROSI|nr:hypothetical protein K2173_009668 [Erythroxylum novogranatense]
MGHSPISCSQRSQSAGEGPPPSAGDGVTPSDPKSAGDPGVVESLEGTEQRSDDVTSNGYGPWTNVQRRRPRAKVTRQLQITGTAPSTNTRTSGLRFAALDEAGAEDSTPFGPQEVRPQLPAHRLGQRVSFSSAHGPGLLKPQAGPSRPATQPQCSTRRSKGKTVQSTSPVPQDLGQTSGGPTPLVALTPLIQLQPTTAERNIVVVISSHSEMICDSQLMAATTLGPEERPHSMEGIEALELEEGPPTSYLWPPLTTRWHPAGQSTL